MLSLTTKELGSTQFSILIESEDVRTYWYKIDFDVKPYMNINKCGVDGSFDYNRHDHTVDPQHYKFINPPSPVLIDDQFDIRLYRDVSTAAVIGHKVYKVIRSKVMFFDLDDAPSSSWSPLPSSPCITPLLKYCRPKLLSHKGRLYIIGCKVDNDTEGVSDSQFGFIFDPENESWDDITMPDVDVHLQPRFSTASIRGGILLMLPEPRMLDDESEEWRPPPPPYYLDTETGEWFEYTVGVHLNVPDIIVKPVVVEEESTVYWINTMGRIYAHNLETCETRFGPIIGLEYTQFLNSILDDDMDVSLFHVMGDLFCLLYQDPSMPCSQTSDLHCLITRLIKLKSSVFLIVIGCFCAPVSGACCFRNSFLVFEPRELVAGLVATIAASPLSFTGYNLVKIFKEVPFRFVRSPATQVK
ncbi:hypothetical protein POM88_009308 [Heracleum sosnowskyi]|uniref:Uncharacterized protein n=1 Tax=Heracleum sosnowskyi TaxID=360622 RepID=A0AAD8JBG7_9APIA|nr:hypothetical protein POM88_009308 [Heracleum sosnowskyi]